MKEKTYNKGGAGLGQGRKKMSAIEKKQPLTIYIQGTKIEKLGGKAKALAIITKLANDYADNIK